MSPAALVVPATASETFAAGRNPRHEVKAAAPKGAA
jgi:hypothetical protein